MQAMPYKKSKVTLCIASVLALLTGGIVHSAEQQTDTTQPAKEEKEQKILVTGSRIKNSSIVSPIPLQSISLDEIASSGTADLNEIMTEIPGVYGGTTPQGSLLATQNAGLSSVSLRNLGSTRTLTLLDGRRVVSNSGEVQLVDTATIPAGFVERIEITTGGASAAYGSDAISGVANIVLRESFHGFNADLRIGDTDEGGGAEQTLNLFWGSDFGNGKGEIMIGAFYDNRDDVMQYDRDFGRDPYVVDFETGRELNYSSSLPGGLFEGDAWMDQNGVWHNDVVGSQYCIDDGRVPACDDYQEAFDGYDFLVFGQIYPERDRSGVMIKSTYDISDTLKSSFLFQYTDISTHAERAPATASNGTTFGPVGETIAIGSMAADHPFIHPAVEETRVGTVSWSRRFTEVGNRYRESQRETTRISFGLDGEFNPEWSWSFYAGYGEYQQNQNRQNELNKRNIQWALDIEETTPGSGSYQCASAEARNLGCVPLNLFGLNSISAEAADFIRATDKLYVELNQTTSSFVVNGDLFELPAGTAQVAMGIDYRKEEQQTVGDPDTNAGLTTTGFIPSLQGDFDVTEAFIEMNLPLIRDVSGIKSLDAVLAYRSADYSSIGGVSSWNYGLTYRPFDDLHFRVQKSQAQRAPTIIELNSPLRSDFDDITDPCDGVTATSTGVIDENCRSIPSVLAAINDPEGDGSFQQEGSQVFGPNGGNKDLFEETADTFTYGFAYTPSWLEGFSMVADYYQIEVEDAISTIDSQEVLDACYTDPNFNNRFCSAITRSPEDGQVDLVINKTENLNSLRSEGIDLTLGYDFKIPSVPGSFKSKLVYSKVLANESRFDIIPGQETVDVYLGETDTPEHEYRFTLFYKYSDLSLRLTSRYHGSAIDDNDYPVYDPDLPYAYKKVPSVMIHNIYASYKFGNDDYTLYAGINNISDEHGPYYPDNYQFGHSSNVSSVYDRLGRRFYVGLKASF